MVQLLLDVYPDGANATDCVSAPLRPDPTSPCRTRAVRVSRAAARFAQFGITPARMAKREGYPALARLIEHYVPEPPGSYMFEFNTIFDIPEFNTIFDMAFQMGIDQGTEKGSKMGFDQGFDTGFDKGFEMGFDEIPSLEKKQEMLRNMLRRETLRKMTSEKHENRLEKHEMLLDMMYDDMISDFKRMASLPRQS